MVNIDRDLFFHDLHTYIVIIIAPRGLRIWKKASNLAYTVASNGDARRGEARVVNINYHFRIITWADGGFVLTASEPIFDFERRTRISYNKNQER